MQKSTEKLRKVMLDENELEKLTLLLDQLDEARDNITIAINTIKQADTIIQGGKILDEALLKSQKLNAEPNEILDLIALPLPF